MEKLEKRRATLRRMLMVVSAGMFVVGIVMGNPVIWAYFMGSFFTAAILGDKV